MMHNKNKIKAIGTLGKRAAVKAAIMAGTAVAAVATAGTTVFAAGNVSATLQNLETTSNNVFVTIGNYTWILIAAALVGCGILYLVGGEEGKQRANKWIPRILIGTVLILCAVSLAQWIATDLVV